jgi:hypothetical protein
MQNFVMTFMQAGSATFQFYVLIRFGSFDGIFVLCIIFAIAAGRRTDALPDRGSTFFVAVP